MINSNRLIRATKNGLRRFGFDLSRYQASSHPIAKRSQQIRNRGINCVLDVGANAGQYAMHLRELGYQGQILSFEPLSNVFKILSNKAAMDSRWDTYNYALGNSQGELSINIAENSWSSSLLSVADDHIRAEPTAQCIGSETIHVKRLDDILQGICSPSDKILLKIDTQGYEKHVLEGAQQSMEQIDMLQLELSFVPLYEGQPLFVEMYDFVNQLGFQLACLEEAWWDPNSGRLMQIDGVFQRP